MVRKFPIFQTTGFRKTEFMKLIDVHNERELVDFFMSDKGQFYLPNHYDHKDPEHFFQRFRSEFKTPKNWVCGDDDLVGYSSDCHLFFNTWTGNGIPGIIHTQTGVQRSLARTGHSKADTLKYHSHYDTSWEKIYPEVCLSLQNFGVDRKDVLKLRAMMERDKDSYSLTKLFRPVGGGESS